MLFGYYVPGTYVMFNGIVYKVESISGGGWHKLEGLDKKVQTGKLTPVPGPVVGAVGAVGHRRTSKAMRAIGHRSPVGAIGHRSPKGLKRASKSPIDPSEYEEVYKVGSQIFKKKQFYKETAKRYYFKKSAWDNDQDAYEVYYPKSSVQIIKRCTRDACKNKETFLESIPVHQVQFENFYINKDDYCFTVEELNDYINSEDFDNKNPFNKKIDLFNIQNATISGPFVSELKKWIIRRQDSIIKELNGITDEDLYNIAVCGRICYFNNLYSHSTDSDLFVNSITALANLSTVKRVQELTYYGTSIKKAINDANKGNTCIHGTGYFMISLFIKYFGILVKTNSLIYDPVKTGLYFLYTGSASAVGTLDINMISIDTRVMSANMSVDIPVSMTIKDTKDIKYPGQCINESDLFTHDSADSWNDVKPWAIIKISDGSRGPNGGQCFDIMYMITVITNNLCNIKMSNPYPVFPNNPFTRSDLLADDFLRLKNKINDNYIEVRAILNHFLNSPELWTPGPNWRTKTVDNFEKTMRYYRYWDGSDISGVWVPKNTSTDNGEQLILEYLNTANENVLNNIKKLKVTEIDFYSLEKVRSWS
jgi:hypothetical protein